MLPASNTMLVPSCNVILSRSAFAIVTVVNFVSSCKLGENNPTLDKTYPIVITIKIDTALVAIGQSANPLVPKTVEGLKVGKWGNIETDDDGRTNIPCLFAGGDIATGAATVILAMGAGKRAARAIDEYLKSKNKNLNKKLLITKRIEEQ